MNATSSQQGFTMCYIALLATDTWLLGVRVVESGVWGLWSMVYGLWSGVWSLTSVSAWSYNSVVLGDTKLLQQMHAAALLPFLVLLFR